MQVDEPVGRVFLIEVLKNMGQNDVFEHIGMIACMKTMAVTEQMTLRYKANFSVRVGSERRLTQSNPICTRAVKAL